MSFLSKNNALTIGLVAIVALGVAYLMFFSGSSPTADVTSDAPASSPQEFLFVSLASQLNNINFDDAVLNDDRFKALVNIKTQITPEDMQREDPFAPLPGVAKKAN